MLPFQRFVLFYLTPQIALTQFPSPTVSPRGRAQVIDSNPFESAMAHAKINELQEELVQLKDQIDVTLRLSPDSQQIAEMQARR
jgi:hypothetical protein